MYREGIWSLLTENFLNEGYGLLLVTFEWDQVIQILSVSKASRRKLHGGHVGYKTEAELGDLKDKIVQANDDYVRSCLERINYLKSGPKQVTQ